MDLDGRTRRTRTTSSRVVAGLGREDQEDFIEALGREDQERDRDTSSRDFAGRRWTPVATCAGDVR